MHYTAHATSIMILGFDLHLFTNTMQSVHLFCSSTPLELLLAEPVIVLLNPVRATALLKPEPTKEFLTLSTTLGD